MSDVTGLTRIRDIVEASGYVTRPLALPGDAAAHGWRVRLRRWRLRDAMRAVLTAGVSLDIALVVVRSDQSIDVSATAPHHQSDAAIIADHLSRILERPISVGSIRLSIDPF